MKRNSVKFGTGGWRAIIGDEFTKSNIRLVSRAISVKIKREKADDTPVVIGYDRRFLSKEAMIWAAEVLASNGIKVMLIDSSSPTPLVMFYTMVHNLNYGIMITASHNPSLYNGIKVFTKGGRDANEVVTAEIESIINEIADDFCEDNISDIETLIKEGKAQFFNPLNEYLDAILDKIDVSAIKNAHLKIAIDALYGVSIRSLNTIFSTARCDVEMLHSEHDTLFAGKMPAPDKDTVKMLQNHVTDYLFDLGIATDGDADRIGLVDDTGKYIAANEMLCILYYYFLEYKNMKTDVVKNLATTQVLDKIAKAYGQTCYEVPVGFKHISSKMAETGAYIGGESSGGLTVADHINGKDAIYSAALLVETVAKTGKKLSVLAKEVFDKFGYYHLEEQNVVFKASRKSELVDQIYNHHIVPQFEEEVDRISFLDGCKIFFKNGDWLLIRFSGTEPLLRIFAEVPEENYDRAVKYCETVKKFYNI